MKKNKKILKLVTLLMILIVVNIPSVLSAYKISDKSIYNPQQLSNNVEIDLADVYIREVAGIPIIEIIPTNSEYLQKYKFSQNTNISFYVDYDIDISKNALIYITGVRFIVFTKEYGVAFGDPLDANAQSFQKKDRVYSKPYTYEVGNFVEGTAVICGFYFYLPFQKEQIKCTTVYLYLSTKTKTHDLLVNQVNGLDSSMRLINLLQKFHINEIIKNLFRNRLEYQ